MRKIYRYPDSEIKIGINDFYEPIPEDLKDLKEALLMEDGRVMPVGVKEFEVAENKPNTLAEQVARILDNKIFQRATSQSGFDTIEEANDFDIGDEDEPLSGYEITDMSPEEYIQENIPSSGKETVQVPENEPKAEPES